MILSNEKFQVEITKDMQYTLFSTDNYFYNLVLSTEEFTRNDLVCAYSMAVHGLKDDFKVAFIGRAYGSIENCAVLEDTIIVVLVDNYVLFFDLISKKLEKKVMILDFGTGIELYAFDNGYIVNGEVDIIKIDKTGKKIWSFSGRDIFVTPNRESALDILDDSILVKDWQGYTYHLDKMGKEIKSK